MFFTETHITNHPVKHLDELEDGWIDIHKGTEHGLAICYYVRKINIIEEI